MQKQYVVVFLFANTVIAQGSNAAANPCAIQLNDVPPAFCETFDQPYPATTRAEQLDGVLWGVSRLTGQNNLGQGLYDAVVPAAIDACGGSVSPTVPDSTDVIVCNGQLREAVNDNQGVTSLGLYPKQPFDFAGRTGTIAFDVSNDTGGIHAAWPELWITDQPVIGFTHGSSAGVPCYSCGVPRNGLAIRFSSAFLPQTGAQAPNCPNDSFRRWTVESLTVASNYVLQDISLLNNNVRSSLGCVIEASGSSGPLNHIEVRVSVSQVEVWATDPGSTKLVLLSRTAVSLPFTRGLVWIEDVHYNADKDGPPFQRNHTFTWDNLAFDGPVLTRDINLDVLDSRTPTASA